MSSMTNIAASAPSSRHTLVNRAMELGPALRDRCTETNDLRRLPDTTWNELIRTGILRALPANALGWRRSGFQGIL